MAPLPASRDTAVAHASGAAMVCCAAAEEPLSEGADFRASGPLLLPRSSLVCLRLPYVYSAPRGRTLVTKATAGELATPREAVLLPGWLCSASHLGGQAATTAPRRLPSSSSSQPPPPPQPPTSDSRG